MSGMTEEQVDTIDDVIQSLAAYRISKRSENKDPVGVRMITDLIERVKKHFPIDQLDWKG
jgi:hypothetical protein